MLLRLLKSLKRNVRDDDLTISKADIGDVTVILSRNDYILKVNNFLNSDSFTLLNRNSLNSYTTYLKSTLKTLKPTLDALCVPNFNGIVPMNPSMPLLYDLPKIHKVDIPVRPVVNFINSPAYRLSSILNNLIEN